VRSLIPLQGDPEPAPKIKRSNVLRGIKSALCRAAGIPRTTKVSISEVRCPDPGCPDVETVMAVFLEDGRVRRFRVPKPLAEVGPDDVRDVVRAGVSGEGGLISE
jgi:hypothetical protein